MKKNIKKINSTSGKKITQLKKKITFFTGNWTQGPHCSGGHQDDGMQQLVLASDCHQNNKFKQLQHSSLAKPEFKMNPE